MNIVVDLGYALAGRTKMNGKFLLAWIIGSGITLSSAHAAANEDHLIPEHGVFNATLPDFDLSLRKLLVDSNAGECQELGGMITCIAIAFNSLATIDSLAYRSGLNDSDNIIQRIRQVILVAHVATLHLAGAARLLRR